MTTKQARRGSSASICGVQQTERVSYALGFDLGFAKSPTAGAFLGFDTPQPRLIATYTIRPQCGGDWQGRVSSVLEQIKGYLAIEILPYYPPLLLVYSLPHGRDNMQTALKLADLGGGIRGLAAGFGLPCIGIQESESKVALTDSAQASKTDMIAAARRIFGRDFTEHEADAVGHTFAGEANYRRALLVSKGAAR